MIGKMVIQKLHENEVDILVFDPFLPEEKAAELGVKKTSLEEIFATCQTVSNHLANKEEIRGILTAELFASMPDNACFINTGRGAQVDEAGLIAALIDKPTRSAVLDVTWPEPPAADSPLYTLPNVYLTPHIAGSLGNEVWRMAMYAYEEYLRFCKGEPLQYAVSEQMLATMA